MVVSLGGQIPLTGSRVVFVRGAKVWNQSIGCARLVSSATGRWKLTFDSGQLVIDESGIR